MAKDIPWKVTPLLLLIKSSTQYWQKCADGLRPSQSRSVHVYISCLPAPRSSECCDVCCNRVVSTPASHSGCLGFRFRPEERLSRLNIFVIFLSSSERIRRYFPELGYVLFSLRSFRFIRHSLTLLSFVSFEAVYCEQVEVSLNNFQMVAVRLKFSDKSSGWFSHFPVFLFVLHVPPISPYLI